MFMGTLEPFMEAVHVLKNEISTIFSFAAMTEKSVPRILQYSLNRKFELHKLALLLPFFYYLSIFHYIIYHFFL